MRIANARDAADRLRPLLEGGRGEGLVVMHLDRLGMILAIDEFGGCEAEVALPVRAIIRRTLNLGAHALVIAHNHPSGDAMPSDADLVATRRLARACTSLDIILHDHLIFAGEACESLRQLGELG